MSHEILHKLTTLKESEKPLSELMHSINVFRKTFLSSHYLSKEIFKIPHVSIASSTTQNTRKVNRLGRPKQ